LEQETRFFWEPGDRNADTGIIVPVPFLFILFDGAGRHDTIIQRGWLDAQSSEEKK